MSLPMQVKTLSVVCDFDITRNCIFVVIIPANGIIPANVAADIGIF